jgi:hypothetical protein
MLFYTKKIVLLDPLPLPILHWDIYMADRIATKMGMQDIINVPFVILLLFFPFCAQNVLSQTVPYSISVTILH